MKKGIPINYNRRTSSAASPSNSPPACPIIASSCCQPEIAKLDGKDVAELFDYLLANPLRSVIYSGRERYLIVVDALRWTMMDTNLKLQAA